MSFKVFGHGNPCPVCGQDKGDCRYKLEDTDFIQCHEFVGAKKLEKINGFVCVKGSNGGHTSAFKPDNSAEWSDKRQQELEASKIHRQQEAALEKEQRISKLLSIEDRNRGYREIASRLDLKKHHVSSLINNRGLTIEEIDFASFQGWIRSWQPGLEVNGVSEKLAGVTQGFTQRLLGVPGISISATDGEDHLVAHQIGSDDRERFAKYFWLSSNERKGNSPHLPNGEIPLFIWRHPGTTEIKETWLVEGSLKSLILALKAWFRWERTDVQIIGAVGANFAGSPETFKKALSIATSKEIKLFPDAGSTNNLYITNQYEKAWKFTQELAYHIEIAWWGQLDKSLHSDVDELDNLTQVKYILSDEFLAIAKLARKEAERTKASKEAAQQKEEEFIKLSKIRKNLTKIVETPYKVVNVPTLEGELESLIEPGTANIILSAPGTGKSKGSRPIIEKAGACSSWHNRLALAESTATDFQITFKNEKSGNLSRVKKVAGCSPSMVNYDPKHLRDKGIVFCDEADQVVDFSFSDICNRDGIRPLVLTAFESQIRSALSGSGNLLALSADITQKEIDYFRALTPDGIPFRYIVNEHQPKRGTIHLDNSGSPEGLVDELIQRLKRGERCFVLDDLKNGLRGCKSIAEYIRKILPEIANQIIEIHADNVDDPRVKAFRHRADEESKQYLCVICSPSIVAGISIVNQLFIDGIFVFAQGILSDRSIKQFINRVRGAQNIYLWITEEGFPPRGIGKDLFTHEEIRAYFKRNYEANSKHIMSMLPDYQPIDDEWHSPHFALYCKNLSYHACTMKYLKRFTIEHLQEEGYTIVDANFVPDGGTQNIEEALKIIWGNIEITEALAIASARFLSSFEMDTLKNADNIPPELLPAYKKTQLKETFGEILIEATTFEHKATKQTLTGYAAMSLKNARNEYFRCLENFWLLSQDTSESVSKDYRAEARQMKHGERFPGDIKWNTRRRKFHEWVGLKNFLKAGEWWEPKDFQHVAEKAKSRPNEVKDAFNYTVSDVHDNQLFDELIKRLGLKIKTKSVKGQRWKLRSIDEDSWNHCQMYVQYKESLKVQEPVEESIGVAEMIAEATAEDRETYEAAIYGVDPELVERALQKVSQEVRDRIAGFYYRPEPIQLSIESIVPKPITLISPQDSAAATLRQVTSWEQVTQELIDLAWWIVAPEERDRLTALYDSWQQPTIEDAIQQAIATGTPIKEVGFGLHFRSYKILEVIAGGIAWVQRCWGNNGMCQIPVNQLIWATG